MNNTSYPDKIAKNQDPIVDHSKSLEQDSQAYFGNESLPVNNRSDSGWGRSPCVSEQIVVDLSVSNIEGTLDEERLSTASTDFQRGDDVHPARTGQGPDNLGGKRLLRHAWVALQRLMERTVATEQERTGYGLDEDAANAAEHLFKMLKRDLRKGDDTTSQEMPQPRAVTVTAGEDLMQVVECYCPDSEQAGMRVKIMGLRALLRPSSATRRVVTTPCRHDLKSHGVHYACEPSGVATVGVDSHHMPLHGSLCSVLGITGAITTVCLQGDACCEIFTTICASIRVAEATDAYKRRLLWFMGSLCGLYNTVVSAADVPQDEGQTLQQYSEGCLIPDGCGWRNGRGRGCKTELTIGPFNGSILLNGWAMARYHSREPGTGVEDLATYRDAGQMFEYPKAVNDDVRRSVAILAAQLSETENDRWAGWCSMWAYVKSEHDVGLGHLDQRTGAAHLQTGELFSLARGMTVGVHQKLVKLCIAAFNGHKIWRQWQGVETESSECELCAVGSADPLQAIWGNGEVEITVCGHGGMEDDGSETMLVVTQALLLLSVLDQAHTGDLTEDEWRAHKDHHTAKVDVLSIAAQVTSALQRFNVIQEASHRFGADKTFDKMWVIFYTTHLIVRFDTRLRDAAQAYVDSNAADMYEAMWLGTDEIYGRLTAYLAASAHPHWAYRPILNVAAPGRSGDY
ncbi:hypothetical protein BGZ67_007170 [Mortierella alpina]|nr:hypothetical protein BGZ67_007170 [Mortierella alpina]